MKTYTPRPRDLEPKWLSIDASGQVLGRLATIIAHHLMGKHKPMYDVNLVMGDKIVVTNAAYVRLTGKKETDKIYYRHTTYPGGIRQRTVQEQRQKDPTQLIIKAVKGMLPRNARGYAMLKNLFVYADQEHPHAAQQVKPLFEEQGE
jgi:large subunit ribosomal protein L13